MQTRFEHFATASMLGSDDSPPRCNGKLSFDRDWEGRAFGMALALSKQGHYDWEQFRQNLIAAIGEWEAGHARDDPSWDYYQRWLLALERLLEANGMLSNAEIEARTQQLLTQLQCCSDTEKPAD